MLGIPWTHHRGLGSTGPQGSRPRPQAHPHPMNQGIHPFQVTLYDTMRRPKMTRFVIYLTRPDGMRFRQTMAPCPECGYLGTWAEARAELEKLRAKHPSWTIWLVGICIGSEA